MAARHIARLRDMKQLQEAAAKNGEEQESDEEESEEEEDSVGGGKPFNPFDLLGDEDNFSDPGEQDADDVEEQQEEAAAPPPPPKQHQPAAGQGNKKGKKGGKKGAKKGAGGGREAGGHEQGGGGGKAVEEDIDAILQDLNIQLAAKQGQAGEQQQGGSVLQQRRNPQAVGSGALLAVDVRRLQPEDELRAIFGHRVVDSDERGDDAGVPAGAPRRYRRLAARGLLRRQPMKRGLLISPKDHWPPLEGGLSMQQDGVDDQGRMVFRYTHSAAYKAVQDAYEAARDTHDPNHMAALLGRHPYHVDALLAMFDVYRVTGDVQYADEVLDAALYALEMAWHPFFSPATGNCRLDWGVAENRPLFTALFRHMQGLSRRGLHSTALEACKLLLALDPADPMGGVFYLDYLCIRARAFGLLARTASEYDALGGGAAGLATLPNFAFSLALAKFEQQQQQGGGGGSASGNGADTAGGGSQRRRSRSGAAGSSGAGTGAGGGGGEGDFGAESADEALAHAVMMYPLVVTRLMEKLADKGVGKDSFWQSVLGHKFFSQASDGGSASLDHVVDIYVERGHLLWKGGPVNDWLRRVCNTIITEEEPFGCCPADWAVVAAEVFPPNKDNQYGHLRLHDYSDARQALPQEEVAAIMGGAAGGGGGGPMGGGLGGLALDLAPEELQALAQRLQQMGAGGPQQQQAGGRGVELTDQQLAGANPLMALLQSFLPWVNVRPAAVGGGEGNPEAGQPPPPDVAAAIEAALEATAEEREQQHGGGGGPQGGGDGGAGGGAGGRQGGAQ